MKYPQHIQESLNEEATQFIEENGLLSPTDEELSSVEGDMYRYLDTIINGHHPEAQKTESRWGYLSRAWEQRKLSTIKFGRRKEGKETANV